jgi:hypothetical protein
VLDHPSPERWAFRPNGRRVALETQREEALARANKVLSGQHHAYRATWRPLPGAPDEWNTDLATGHRYDQAVPWFLIPHTSRRSDIKDAWEPGRFGWGYDLARGWLITGEDRYADAFWRAFEAFRAGCPPYRGVQWACGQETAIRAIALLWSECALTDAPSSSAARMKSLREIVYFSGHRIADAVDYALSQRNNHGISECVGLMAVGARFRAVDSMAEAWWREGRRALEDQVLDQFARDGWYAQHSFTYLRVALDQLVHAQRLLHDSGDGLSEPAAERVRAAVRLLGTVIENETGDVPNHGANDGAFVLPLTTRAFRDFRSSLTGAATTFRVPLSRDMEPDAEVLAWLDADPPATADDERPRVVVGESGWLDARGDRARVFARGGVYRSRPSHIDATHLNVWVDHRPIAVDAGTYRYVGRWGRALADELAHNTVAIDARPVAQRGPRFLWLRWPRATIASFHDAGDTITIEMVNESWRDAGIEHRRTCRLAGDGVTVLDEVSLPPSNPARVSVHWLLDATRYEVVVAASAPVEIDHHCGEEDVPYGWIADSYAIRRPATSLRFTTRDPSTRVRFASGFGTARSEEHLRAVLSGGIGAVTEAASLLRSGSR